VRSAPRSSSASTVSRLPCWAARWSERTAIVSPDARLSYRELAERAQRLANGLHALGVRRGERVVVQLPNLPEFVIVCFALFRLGVAPVFALPAHRQSEIGHLCELSEAVAYVIPAVHHGFDYRPLAERVRASTPSLRHVIVVGEPGAFSALTDLYEGGDTGAPAPGPQDVALFQLSGGTTGLPKLIPRLHE